MSDQDQTNGDPSAEPFDTEQSPSEITTESDSSQETTEVPSVSSSSASKTVSTSKTVPTSNTVSTSKTATATATQSTPTLSIASLLNITDILGGGKVDYAKIFAGRNISELIHDSCIRSPKDKSSGITLQNATSWKETGCLKGFYCAWTDPKRYVDQDIPFDQLLPQYCTPEDKCAKLRLAGGDCGVPMGLLEPVLCQAGHYCPPGGKQQLTCPPKHYCPEGAIEAKPCSFDSVCPEGSSRNVGLAPFVLLIVIDILIILVTLFLKFRTTIALSRHGHIVKQRQRYVPVANDTEYFASDVERGAIAMESRVPLSSGREAAGFQKLGAMETSVSVNHLHSEAHVDSTDLHLFVQSLTKCFGGGKFGLSFEFEDLKFQPPKAVKPILSQVSGCINEGSLWGVMGASGAGKSTFVNVLMGKTSHTGGITKVNGVAGDIKKYKKIIGYVPQDDIVLPELTVRENILHSARIRLPCSWSDSEIQHHVDILISCLQLSHVKDSLVGSPGAPVISGGQRKRVSIGMELAAAPMAVFLDEPTSGLDATAANSIMSTLKALTRLGMTIVVIIHQPREEIFESLDNLVLLGAGRMIYQGPQQEMQPHFEKLGFQFPDHGNPADTMGDIIAGEGKIYKHSGDASIQPLINYWQEHKASHAFKDERDSAFHLTEAEALASTIKTRGAYFHKQIYYCFLRSIVQQFRLKSSFFFELGVGALAGFLIGLAQVERKGAVFHGIFHPPYELLSRSIDFQNVPMMALLVALSIGLTASAPGVKIFGEEKLVYWREAAAGHNRLAYYLGKVLSTFPRMLLACFHFSVLFLLLSTPRISWGEAFAVHILYFYCIYGFASIISMVARREDGPLLAVMASLIIGILSGASPSLKKARAWHMVWLWRASPGTWLAEAYFTKNIKPYDYLYNIQMAEKAMGYKFDQFNRDLLLLLAIGTIYRVVAFLGLKFMFPSKQR